MSDPYRSVVMGVGHYLPQNTVENQQLSGLVDTTDEWIRERTGIERRHIAGPSETTATLGFHAAQRALQSANASIDDIDLVVVATATPDNTFPSTATMVQEMLGMRHGAAFDVAAVCSGFVYALSVADGFLARGNAKGALVIGAETFSRILDWTDRGTCVLFGDGAGAVYLKAIPTGEAKNSGILASVIRSDGRYKELLFVDGGAGSSGHIGKLRMIGNQVFRHAVVNISSAIEQALQKAGLCVEDVDWFVPHLANKGILDGVAKRLGIPEERVVMTLADHANTSAASIPLALSCAIEDGRVKPGDLVLVEAMGGGFTWGASLLRM
jgi:3-oxoacyl-[acyl-carrier-protein] synthase III